MRRRRFILGSRNERRYNVYLFKDKYNLGKPFIYIHPYKQLLAKQVTDRIFAGISHLLVFGSAVSLACKPYSDLDICVIGDFCESNLSQLRIPGEHLDLIHYTSADVLMKDRRLYKEIASKGVKIHG